MSDLTPSPDSPSGSEHVAKKDCRWCGYEIPVSARVCRECKSYQAAWRSVAVYVASIASFIALFGSATTFIAANWETTLRKLFASEKITVAYLNILPGHDRRIVILNKDDNPVFVTSVVVYWHGGNEDFSVEKTIQPHEFAVIDDKEDSSWHFGGFIGTSDGSLPEWVLKATVNNSGSKEGCFVTNFYNATADDLRRMDSTYQLKGTRLVIDGAEAKINYFTAHTEQPLAQWFPVVATFLQRDTESCTKAN